jgi:hypothetical protein
MTTVDCWQASLTPDVAEAPSLEERFSRTLVESVEETISAVLGKNVAEAFAYHFHSSVELTREEIPSHLKELSSALKWSFGVGGTVLERAIVRRLYSKLGLTLVQKPDCSFVECIEDAKKMFLVGDHKD